MHNYHLNRGTPRCAFKVDIQKAYDIVNWRFLGDVLKGFGFHQSMIKWIMDCVTSASFSISLNGDIHGFFKGKQGLRQGDPLSPYLFTLVMEVLTLMLQRRVNLSESFRYHKYCEKLYIINVCFAADLFLFAHGDVNSARVIMDSLDEFKSTSGLPVKYLGVPLISSRLLNMDCKVLVESAKNRIGDWKNKTLSFAGRLQLCKSVISSMQVYWASVLAIPKGIISDIQNLLSGFLWCNGAYKRGKAKVAWDIICLPTREGGLGIRSLKLFNKALMTKHIWNIVSNNESLWVRWIHVYKLKGRSFWVIPLNATEMSWGWRKLPQLRALVRPFIWANIGNGNRTSAWYDIWDPHCLLSVWISPRDITREGFTMKSCVADIAFNDGWVWPQDWLRKAPNLHLIQIPNLIATTADSYVWCDSIGNRSEFSVECA
ncbi:putative RNA-directed DNA polymerase [Tanacetum coccineum]|uniref:RNA-directed DNA polymerase n=1 Tax=Tanacetum coccineum TaxID=301880 RepID=A0ABQ4Z6B2_9ASTR